MLEMFEIKLNWTELNWIYPVYLSMFSGRQVSGFLEVFFHLEQLLALAENNIIRVIFKIKASKL